jgi:hypothetical protein
MCRKPSRNTGLLLEAGSCARQRRSGTVRTKTIGIAVGALQVFIDNGDAVSFSIDARVTEADSGSAVERRLSVKQTEFNELHTGCVTAFKTYVVEAEKTSMMLANCTAEPLPLTQRFRVMFQERAENTAHLVYLGMKRLLHNAARLTPLLTEDVAARLRSASVPPCLECLDGECRVLILGRANADHALSQVIFVVMFSMSPRLCRTLTAPPDPSRRIRKSAAASPIRKFSMRTSSRFKGRQGFEK